MHPNADFYGLLLNQAIKVKLLHFQGAIIKHPKYMKQSMK